MKKSFKWIEAQQKNVTKIFAPSIDYDSEFDILSIRWLPQWDVEYSLETNNGIVFDIGKFEKKKGNNKEVIGLEIFDFKRKYMKIKKEKMK